MQAFKLIKILAYTAVAALLMCACGEKSPEELERANQKKSELAVRRAQVMIAENKLDDAIAMLENAYSECGANTLVCETLANVFAQKGQTASAGMFYELAYDSDNSRPEMLVFAANAYEATDSIDAAVNAYEKYVEKKPEDADIRKKLSAAYEKQGKYREALDSLNAFLKLSKRPPDTSEAAVIGRLYIGLKDIKNAKLWLETALKVTLPENTQTRKEIGLSLIRVYRAEKDANKLEEIVAMLDAIDRKLVNDKYPTLKANIAEYKHIQSEEKIKAEAKKAREEAEAAQKEVEMQNAAAKKQVEDEKKALAQSTAAKQNAQEGKSGEEIIDLTPEDAKNNAAPAEKKVNDGSATPNTPKESKTTAPSEKADGGAVPAQGETGGSNDKDVAKTIPEGQKAKTGEPAAIENHPLPPQEPLQEQKKQPADFDVYALEAEKAIKASDGQNALVYANKAISERIDSAKAWQLMARAYELNGSIDNACLAANEAYLINPSDENAIFLLGLLQKNKNAQNFLTRALSLYDKHKANAEFDYWLACAYRDNSDEANARKYFEKYAKSNPADKEHKRQAEEYLNK